MHRRSRLKTQLLLPRSVIIVIIPLILPALFYQVEHEFIYYVHDGSETATDNFTVGANDTGLRKHSAGQTVYVQVTAVNDEPPLITANRVLRVSRHCCAIFKPLFLVAGRPL